MPHNLTDVDTFTDPIQTVSDGDDASAANFDLGYQGLANRSKHLYLHGRVIDMQDASGIAAFNMATSTWTDVPGSTVILGDGGVVGDRLAIDLFAFIDPGLDVVNMRVVVHDSGADAVIAASVVAYGPGALPGPYVPAGAPVAMSFRHVLAGSGGATVRLQIKNNDNASTVSFRGSINSLRVTQCRL